MFFLGEVKGSNLKENNKEVGLCGPLENACLVAGPGLLGVLNGEDVKVRVKVRVEGVLQLGVLLQCNLVRSPFVIISLF